MPKKYEFCTYPSCDRVHRANGYCMLHLNRSRRGLPMDMPKQKRGPVAQESCSVSSCDRDHYAKSMCRYHYERSRVGTVVERPYGEHNSRQGNTLCTGPSCARRAYSKGLCRAHYMQYWHGQELTVIRKHTYGLETENGRVCTMCDREKPKTDYYTRTTGKPQSRCKECMTAKAAIRQYEADKSREYPEWAVAYVKRYMQ